MADLSHPPKSPTLVPPRKSVELEDPGAHDLGAYWHLHSFLLEYFTNQLLTVISELSEAEDDVFSDAQEARNSHSGPSSPTSATKEEKVSHPIISFI